MASAPSAAPPMVATVPTVFSAAPASALVKHRSLKNGFTIVPPIESPNL